MREVCMFSKNIRKEFTTVILILTILLLGGAMTGAGAFSVDVKNLYYYDPSGPREINYDFSAEGDMPPSPPTNTIRIPTTNPPILQKHTADLFFMFGNIPDMGAATVTLNTTSQVCTIATTQGGAVLQGASSTQTPPAPATSWTYSLKLQNFSGITDPAKDYRFEIGTSFPMDAGPQPRFRGIWNASGRLELSTAIFDETGMGTTLWSGTTPVVFNGLTPTATALELRIVNNATTVTFSYRLNFDTVWTDMPGVYTIESGVVFSSLPDRFPYIFLQEKTAESPFQVSSQHWDDAQGNVYKAWPRVNDPGQALYSAVSLNSPGYLTETPLAFNSAAGLWSLSGTLFSDDFNDNAIDTAKWSKKGTGVTESEGVLKVDQAVTDQVTAALSRTIVINPYAKITVQRKAKVHSAYNYFDGLFALYFGDTADFAAGFPTVNSQAAVIVSHANYDYSGGGEQVAHGFYLGRSAAHFPDPTVTSPAITPIWDTWFDEKVVYDPITGAAELWLDGILKATVNVGALPATARYMNVFIQAWGWYTGHYNYSDDMTVSQPWTGGDVLLSTNTPPADPVVFNFTATKQGGGTETVSKTISGFVASFATDLLPTGNVSGTPTFSWTGISGATFYSVQVNDANGNRIWNKNNIPAGTTSAVYNDDSTGPALVNGQTYNYEILSSIVTNGVNNDSFAKGSFTYTGASASTLSFSGWVKTAPNWPSTGGMAALVGASVSAYSPGTTPTLIKTATPDSSTGAFTVTDIPKASDFYLLVQPPQGYMPVLSKIMNWTDNIQALLPFALFTAGPTGQYPNGFDNTPGYGMIIGRVALKDNPTTFLSGATVTATQWLNGAPTATMYPVTYTSGSATGTDGIYMVKNFPTGTLVQLVATLAGYTFEFNSAIIPAQASFISEESFFGTATASCTYAVDPTSASIPAAGITTAATVNVTTGTGCAWTAVSNNSAWLHVSSPGGGTGTGSFSYTVDVNDGAARTGTITAGGQTFTVNQAAGTPPVTNLLQNGSFGGNLNGWIVNPALQTGTPPWTPLLQDGSGVTLHPLTSDFNGTILYQNLNLTEVGGKTFNLSMKLTKVSALSGQTVAAYLTYVDNGILVRSKILTSPANDGISTATPVLGSFNVPSSATKLVKLEIVKEYYGEFHVDDIVLSADGVTVGLLPVVTSLSTPTGTYGASLTITGSNFGTTQGTGAVTIGGFAAGVNVTSWANTSITVNLTSPARSGAVAVIAGQVESNIDKTFLVSSPYFTVDVLNAGAKVIKGQTAEFILKSTFYNGFTTTGGISLQLHDPGTVYLSDKATFTPVPIRSDGGVVLKIDTAALNAGTYTANIQTNDGVTIAFAATVNLTVVTVSDIKGYEMSYVSSPPTRTDLTAKTVTQQGQIYGLQYEVIDSNSQVVSVNPGVVLTSSNPSILGVYKQSFWYSIYAVGNGTADLVATTPDGFTKSLPVTVAITGGAQLVNSVSLTPSTVANTSTEAIAFNAAGNVPIGWIGYDSSGMMNFQTDFLNPDVIQWSGNTASGSFHITKTPSDVGTVLFYAQSQDSSAKMVTPLTVVNDPATGLLKFLVRSVDGSMIQGMFTLAFFDAGGVFQFTRSMYVMHEVVSNPISVGNIPPGSYKILYVPGNMNEQPQWYPNAPTFAGALAVGPFTAGGEIGNIYFFNLAQPAGAVITLSPVSKTFATAATGTGSVTVNATAGAVWAAVSNFPWITVTSGFSGSGNGTVSFAITANTLADPRTETISIGGQMFTVTQAGTAATLPVMGDINKDGSVNLADAILALQVASGMTPTGIRTDYAAVDVNGDNKIGLQELIYILQYVAGLRQ